MSFAKLHHDKLVDFNTGASLALGVLNPLLAQVDFALFGSLGLGAIQANLQAQLTAALKAQLNIGLSISNPLIGFQMALAGIAQLAAQIQAGLALPTVTVSAQLSATAALAASLKLQIGGLQALIAGALQVKLPAVGLAGTFAAKLQLGPMDLVAWTGESFPNVLARINTELGPSYGFLPETHGFFIITQAAAVFQGMAYFFKLS